MKSVIRAVAATVISLTASVATHASTLYDYSYTFGNSTKITGTFDGDANGNIISNLSNITAYVNGTALNGSGHLYASSYSPNSGYGWASGTGVASLDGTANNFLFIDTNYPANLGYTNYFLSIASGDVNTNLAEVYNLITGFQAGDYPYDPVWYTPYDPSRWAISEVSAIPEPASVALLGLGLLALATSRREATAK